MAEDNYTPEEMALLEQTAKEFATVPPEDKFNLHSFLNKIIESDDTTKTGNLTAIEVGEPVFSARTLKDCALLSNKIIGNEYFRDYFLLDAENLTATSLSKDAKLITLATESRRLIENKTKPKSTENKGWFKRKEPVEGGA